MLYHGVDRERELREFATWFARHLRRAELRRRIPGRSGTLPLDGATPLVTALRIELQTTQLDSCNLSPQLFSDEQCDDGRQNIVW